jgi:hypothetical protein
MTSPLGDELVKQNGASAKVDAELGKLQQVIEAEQQRAKRLARWTKIVWLLAVALLFVPAALTVLYMALAYNPAPPPVAGMPTTAPATTQAAAVQAAAAKAHVRQREAAEGAMKAMIVTALLMSLPLSLLLMLVGIVLMVMTFVARRTAGMHEIRASLASIDAQLRLLKRE